MHELESNSFIALSTKRFVRVCILDDSEAVSGGFLVIHERRVLPEYHCGL